MGLLAAFVSTLDRFQFIAACSFASAASCGEGLGSAKWALLGVPNSMVGLACWTALVAVGVGSLAGASYPRWFWLLLTAGLVVALALAAWFVVASVIDGDTPGVWAILTIALVVLGTVLLARMTTATRVSR